MPVAIKIMEILHGKKYAHELKFVPLSNDTVSKQIREISDDMCELLLERIKKAPNLQFNFANQPTFPIQDNFLCMYMCMKTYCFVSHWKEERQVKTFL
jgi:hypothetical protein